MLKNIFSSDIFSFEIPSFRDISDLHVHALIKICMITLCLCDYLDLLQQKVYFDDYLYMITKITFNLDACLVLQNISWFVMSTNHTYHIRMTRYLKFSEVLDSMQLEDMYIFSKILHSILKLGLK